MIRILALALLAANLLFLGWSLLVSDDRVPLQAVAITPRTAPLPPEPPPPCATLGPFSDEVAAVRVQQQLEGAGWGVLRRDVSQQVSDGHWVYVAGLKSVADQSRVLRAIRRAGIQDAFAMPEDPEFRVSVGIFSDAERAEDRARRVRLLKLDAQVAERFREEVALWLDVPGVAAATLADGRLAATGIELEGLTLEACPPAKPAR